VFLTLDYTQSGQTLTIQVPYDTSQIIPGFWMIFAWNDQGVPSEAAMIHVRV
jgi:Domain of unknown function (DUF1929)